MSTDAQPVASSATVDTPPAPTTAVDRAVASNDVSAYREARRAERSGKPLDVPADSSAAPSGDQAASTDAKAIKPASEPGKPKKNADSRVQELLAERAVLRAQAARAEQLERELAELRTPSKTDAKPAASSPAAVETFPTYDAYLAEHPDASYEQYLDERADFRVEQKLKAARERDEASARAERQSQSIQERDAKFRERLDAAVKADPEFMETLSADVLALRPFSAIRDAQGRWTEQPTGYHAVADEVLASDIAPQLLRHFSDHPEDLHRIAKLMPAPLLKEMGKLEAQIVRGKTETPPIKVITDAPAPATTLSTRSSDTGSPVDAAVAADDVRAYREARLRERAANLR